MRCRAGRSRPSPEVEAAAEESGAGAGPAVLRRAGVRRRRRIARARPCIGIACRGRRPLASVAHARGGSLARPRRRGDAGVCQGDPAAARDEADEQAAGQCPHRRRTLPSGARRKSSSVRTGQCVTARVGAGPWGSPARDRSVHARSSASRERLASREGPHRRNDAGSARGVAGCRSPTRLSLPSRASRSTLREAWPPGHLGPAPRRTAGSPVRPRSAAGRGGERGGQLAPRPRSAPGPRAPRTSA